MIAKIAVSAATFAIDKPYSYSIPEGMTLAVGTRVMVPFGRGNRRTEGVVLALESGNAENLKSVERALDEEPLLSEYMLRMAAFLRERYFCTFYDAVRVMLPAALNFRSRDTYRLTEDRSWQDKPPKMAEALKLLNFLLDMGGEAPESAVKTLLPGEDARVAAVKYLIRRKWIVDETDFAGRCCDKTEKIASLTAPVEEVMEYASRCLRAPMQRSVLELMCSLGSVSVKELCYYTGAKIATVKRLAESFDGIC